MTGPYGEQLSKLMSLRFGHPAICAIAKARQPDGRYRCTNALRVSLKICYAACDEVKQYYASTKMRDVVCRAVFLRVYRQTTQHRYHYCTVIDLSIRICNSADFQGMSRPRVVGWTMLQ